MKPVQFSTKGVNKRGKSYNTRPLSKIANGFSKHFAEKCPDKFLKLALWGTFDVLARHRFDVIKVRLRHPTDQEYSKVSYILKKNKDKFNII